jgi:hypothetical protein
LKEFILKTYGVDHKILFSSLGGLPSGIEYVPKFVLTDSQIDGLVGGLGHQLQRSFKG